MDDKEIDVFKEDTEKEKEIFVDYSQNDNAVLKGYVSKKTATISIIATVLVLIIIGASFVAGFFTAKNTGIEGDMPLLAKAYEYVKKYYYEDISFDEFQEKAAQMMVESIDPFTHMVLADEASGSITTGITFTQNVYNEHLVSQIAQGSPAQLAKAKQYCTIPTYSSTPTGTLHYVEYGTSVNVEESNIKIDIGDKLIAISFNGIKPILVSGLTKTNLNALLDEADIITFYFQKSDGEGSFVDEGVYKFTLEKKYVYTKQATLYTPEEIGDTTGETAMIVFNYFEGSAVKDFHDCAQTFVDSGYKKLILDLRNNGGGESTILQYIGGCLIKGADKQDVNIIYEVSNGGNGKKVYKYLATTKEGSLTVDGELETYDAINLPALVEGFELTILCNGRSASCSECLIGALMYYNNAQIIGSKTYGKGVGQIVITFDSGKYYLLITNSRYYIPTDKDGDGVTEWTESIHEIGFTPSDENKIDSVLRPMKTDKAIKRALTLLNN